MTVNTGQEISKNKGNMETAALSAVNVSQIISINKKIENDFRDRHTEIGID